MVTLTKRILVINTETQSVFLDIPPCIGCYFFLPLYAECNAHSMVRRCILYCADARARAFCQTKLKKLFFSHTCRRRRDYFLPIAPFTSYLLFHFPNTLQLRPYFFSFFFLVHSYQLTYTCTCVCMGIIQFFHHILPFLWKFYSLHVVLWRHCYTPFVFSASTALYWHEFRCHCRSVTFQVARFCASRESKRRGKLRNVDFVGGKNFMLLWVEMLCASMQAHVCRSSISGAQSRIVCFYEIVILVAWKRKKVNPRVIWKPKRFPIVSYCLYKLLMSIFKNNGANLSNCFGSITQQASQ